MPPAARPLPALGRRRPAGAQPHVARARSAWRTALGESRDNDEVFTMRPDGSELMNRTNHPAFDAAPDWQRSATTMTTTTTRTTETTTEPPTSVSEGPSPCGPA